MATFRYNNTLTDSSKPESKVLYNRAAQVLTFASTLALPATTAEETLFTLELTGSITINAQAAPYIGDKIRFLFSTNGSQWVVTFGTTFQSSGPLTVSASKFGSAEFQFDGNNWIETSAIATS
jgi:hypothetical protein